MFSAPLVRMNLDVASDISPPAAPSSGGMGRGSGWLGGIRADKHLALNNSG